MKNLKVNWDKIKKIVSTGLAFVVISSFSGCTQEDNIEEDNTESNLETYVPIESTFDKNTVDAIISSNEIIPYEQIKLANSNNEIIEKIDGVIVNNKIMSVANPIDIMFGKEIKVIVDKNIYSSCDFKLVNGNTKKEIKEITSVISGNGILPFNGTSIDKETEETEESTNCKTKVLTDEEFNKLLDSVKKDLDAKNISYDPGKVDDYLTVCNIDALSESNPDKIEEVIGDQTVEKVMQNAYDIESSKVSYDYSSYFETGSTDDFFKVSNVVFSEEDKKIVDEIQKRVNLIGKIEDDEEFNNEVCKLLYDFCDETNPYYGKLSDGAYFALQEVLEPLRGMYGMEYKEDDRFNEKGLNAIKYMVPYAGDEKDYEDNNLLTASILNINGLLKRCTESNVKTLTK